jgi:hypothetical protein
MRRLLSTATVRTVSQENERAGAFFCKIPWQGRKVRMVPSPLTITDAGLGHHLFLAVPIPFQDLPWQWVDYDPQKKQFARTPSLPSWAVPKAKGAKWLTPEQGKALEALFRASKARWEEFAESFQIVRLGQLPKASFEEAKAWLTGKLDDKVKRSA